MALNFNREIVAVDVGHETVITPFIDLLSIKSKLEKNAQNQKSSDALVQTIKQVGT